MGRGGELTREWLETEGLGAATPVQAETVGQEERDRGLKWAEAAGPGA